MPHVYVSTLSGGSFQSPVEVDTSLSGPSSQPVIAAGNGGALLVAFINGGQLYVAGRASGSAPLGVPAALASGASNPSISISNFGKAYVAFTVAAGAGDNVRAAYYYAGKWSVESAPLNQTPGDAAGTGSGRPEVATAGDGVAIVVWGENGHVFVRRVWATSPSVEVQQADGAVAGCTDVSASEPVVGAEGDSSYADVAFDEQISCGGQQQSRVLMNQLQGAVLNGVTAPDGLGGSAAQGAEDPQITMGEYGRGWVTASREQSDDLVATALGNNGTPIGTVQVNGLGETAATDAEPATAGLFSNFIAYQQNPGSAGSPEIRLRFASGGTATLGPEVVLSSASQGATDAGDGLAAAGDSSGDAAVAWLQGGAGAESILVALLYQPPSGFGAAKPLQYVPTAQPVLAWSPAREDWGPIRYAVAVDGVEVAQTEAIQVRVPAPLANGPHHWGVVATNPAGEQSQTGAPTVFVDTVPPIVSFTLTGTRRAGSRVGLFAVWSDPPPAGEPQTDASGLVKVVLHWGDGTTVTPPLARHRQFHVYALPGRYRITLVATDRAGNTAKAVTVVRIAKAPKTKASK